MMVRNKKTSGERNPGESLSQDDFSGLLKVFGVALLLGSIMFLSTMTPETSSYSEHIKKEIFTFFATSALGWVLLLGCHKRLDGKALPAGLAIILSMIIGYSFLLMSPAAREHTSRDAEYQMAKRTLEKIVQQRRGNIKPALDLRVRVLFDNNRVWDAYIDSSQARERRGQCVDIFDDMTVRDLEAYVKNFDPHCADTELGLN